MIAASAAGTSGRPERSGAGSLRTACIVSTAEALRNARSPVSISWRTAPKEKMSER
jgi:hypothetical protein